MAMRLKGEIIRVDYPQVLFYARRQARWLPIQQEGAQMSNYIIVSISLVN